MRDKDLRSDHFFDVAKYPTITFQSKKVESAGAGKLKRHEIAPCHVHRNGLSARWWLRNQEIRAEHHDPHPGESG
jgi:polyisoprenoid-binding protein YceI